MFSASKTVFACQCESKQRKDASLIVPVLARNPASSHRRMPNTASKWSLWRFQPKNTGLGWFLPQDSLSLPYFFGMYFKLGPPKGWVFLWSLSNTLKEEQEHCQSNSSVQHPLLHFLRKAANASRLGRSACSTSHGT